VKTSLRDRVIVITGASRGIGRATALELAADAPRLALLGRDRDALAQVASAARALGAEARSYQGDLRDLARVSAMAAEVLRDFGQVDVLINNAAVGAYARFLDLSPAEWRRELDVNVIGLVAITQALLPSMLERRTGHIVMVGSVQGRQATATSSAYSATKFALRGLTQALALDVGPAGVRVSLLSPGSVETDFDGFPGDLKPNAMLPEDVALAIRALLESGGRAHMSDVTLLPFKERD